MIKNKNYRKKSNLLSASQEPKETALHKDEEELQTETYWILQK